MRVPKPHRERDFAGTLVRLAKHALGFGDPLGGSHEKRPHPYAVTKKLEVRGLTTASGKPPRLATNPDLAKAIALQIE